MSDGILFSKLTRGMKLVVEKNIDGILVPQGILISLQTSQNVFVTQALGDSLTVTANDRLVKIPRELLKYVGVIAPVNETAKTDPSSIFDILQTCFDPEIPVNIVDLGLIYDVRIDKLLDGKNLATVTMTLTAPGCGMGPVIADEVKQKVESLPDIDRATVNLIFDPPWNKNLMSEAAKLETGMF